MPKYKDNMVRINGCTIVWDGINQPDEGRMSLKVVVDDRSPDIDILEDLAQTALKNSQWNGQLPNGGYWAFRDVTRGEFEDMFPNHVVIKGTTNRLPDVYDEDGNAMDAQQYRPLLFTGQKVDILVNCYTYDNKSKGIGCGLEGFAIVESDRAQRLNIGGSGGADTSEAFGGGGGGRDDNRGGRARDDSRGRRDEYADRGGRDDNRGGRDDSRGRRDEYADRGGRDDYGDSRGGGRDRDDNRGGGRDDYGDNRGGGRDRDDSRDRQDYADGRGGRQDHSYNDYDRR